MPHKALKPAENSPFWTLDLTEQVRRAQPYSRRVTPRNLEVIVAKIADWDWHDPSLIETDWFPNMVHAAHVLGLAEGLAGGPSAAKGVL